MVLKLSFVEGVIFEGVDFIDLEKFDLVECLIVNGLGMFVKFNLDFDVDIYVL